MFLNAHLRLVTGLLSGVQVPSLVPFFPHIVIKFEDDEQLLRGYQETHGEMPSIIWPAVRIDARSSCPSATQPVPGGQETHLHPYFSSQIVGEVKHVFCSVFPFTSYSSSFVGTGTAHRYADCSSQGIMFGLWTRARTTCKHIAITIVILLSLVTNRMLRELQRLTATYVDALFCKTTGACLECLRSSVDTKSCTAKRAAIHGHINCLRGTLTGCPHCLNKQMAIGGVTTGGINFVRNMVDTAKNGRRALLVAHGCQSSTICTLAAEHGHLDCLRYAHDNGCGWDSLTCSEAARHGHLDCLQYAHANGCLWNEWTVAAADCRHHVDCLFWAVDNGCPHSLQWPHLAARRIQKAFRAWMWRRDILWNPHTPVGKAHLTIKARANCGHA